MAASFGKSCLSKISNIVKNLTTLVPFTSTLHLRSYSKIPFVLRTGTVNHNAKSLLPAAGLHTTARHYDLKEFFDNKDNWGEQSVRVGRPWKKDELRLKSNEDLHKLWYVLLKERNMLMTMEAEYKRQAELFPNPERMEKVEESMENLLDVVAERDRAYSLLETGESCEPGRRWAYNELGIGYWHKCTEHRVPLYMNRRFQRTTALSGTWQHKFIKLRREKFLAERRRKLKRIYATHRAYVNMFPNAEIETDLSEFQNTMTSKMKGPSS